MSRFQYTNRNLELLEPYEWKRSRTVLRGESGSNVADLPDRPSDLSQRDGRGIRKGNEIAKLYADNKVDVLIYAVEKSLDAYKFNLLQNKQLFINQLKTNNMATRTIDEGSMDEGSGMNFSEYVAVLSGNTDLLEKAKLEKKIAALDSERQAFNRCKSSAIYKYEDATRSIDGNNEMISRITKDLQSFKDKVQIDNEGNKLNPIKLDNLDSINPKLIGEKLNQLSDNARTNGEYFRIGELYGFKLLVKTEESQKEGAAFKNNRFFIEGEGGVKYNYNNGHIALDPLLAATNFLKALERIPTLLEKYQSENQKLEKDMPILKEVIASVFKKEPELKDLKSQLDSLSRQINLSLENKDKTEIAQQPEKVALSKGTVSANAESPPNKFISVETISNIRSNQPMSIKDVIEANPGRIIIAKPNTGTKNSEVEKPKDEPKKNRGIRM